MTCLLAWHTFDFFYKSLLHDFPNFYVLYLVYCTYISCITDYNPVYLWITSIVYSIMVVLFACLTYIWNLVLLTSTIFSNVWLLTPHFTRHSIVQFLFIMAKLYHFNFPYLANYLVRFYTIYLLCPFMVQSILLIWLWHLTTSHTADTVFISYWSFPDILLCSNGFHVTINFKGRIEIKSCMKTTHKLLMVPCLLNVFTFFQWVECYEEADS